MFGVCIVDLFLYGGQIEDVVGVGFGGIWQMYIVCGEVVDYWCIECIGYCEVFEQEWVFCGVFLVKFGLYGGNVVDVVLYGYVLVYVGQYCCYVYWYVVVQVGEVVVYFSVD